MSLQEFLKTMEFKVYFAANSIEGLDSFKKHDIDLCIIDTDLQGIDGFALASQIRLLNPDLPVLFMTKKPLSADFLQGFDYGVDDYIVKPFSNEELAMRIKSVMYRVERNNPFSYTLGEEKLHIGKFVFDTKNMILQIGNQEQPLTRKEAALLKVLYDNRNELLTRKKALKMIWGNSDYFIGRSMDVFIARLRKYLRPDPDVRIVTVHGVGFRLIVAEGVTQNK
jgi:Response regulators consisting of a CheY-like receiver domain and a winged-helix DNA-binding domain